jgi:hypothetical protein
MSCPVLSCPVLSCPVLTDNLNINNDSAAKARYPCVTPGTSCLKAAWYFDDHMSGMTATGNVGAEMNCLFCAILHYC